MTSRRVRSMDELLTLIPALYGDDPSGLGLILILWRGQIHACVRWDLRADAGTLDDVLSACRLQEHDRAIVIGYRCEPGEFNAERVAVEVARSVDVDHVLVVTESHWWAHSCEPGCCDGAIHAWSQPRSNALPTPILRRGNGSAVHDPQSLPSAEQVRRAWSRIVATQTPEAGDYADDLATVSAALHVPHLRDEMTWTIVPELGRRLTGREREATSAVPTPTLRRLRHAAGEAERPYCEAFLALAAWRGGDLKEARRAVGRALRSGHNPLAQLVSDLLAHGLDYQTCVGRLAA